MDNLPPLAITLTQEELYIILAQLKSQKIEGIENHWQKDLNPTNMAMALDIAVRSLIARGLCNPNLEMNRIRLSPSLIALVGVCSDPEISFMLFCQQGEEASAQYRFHFAQKLFVAHTVPFTAIHSFLAFQSRHEFWQGFLSAARIPDYVGDHGTRIELTTSEFDAAQQATRNEDIQGAESVLTQAGLEAGMAKKLTDALSKPDFNLSAARQIHANNETDSLTVLGKDQLLWSFTKGSRDGKMIVQAVSGEQAKRQLRDLAAV